jgi:hypothetical protein
MAHLDAASTARPAAKRQRDNGLKRDVRAEQHEPEAAHRLPPNFGSGLPLPPLGVFFVPLAIVVSFQ